MRYQLDPLSGDFVLGDGGLQVGDDGGEDGRQRHDLRALGHAEHEQLGPAAAHQLHLGVGGEQLEGAYRAGPVHGEEEEPGGALADVVRVQEHGHRRRRGQLERGVRLGEQGALELVRAVVVVVGARARRVAAVHVLHESKGIG